MINVIDIMRFRHNEVNFKAAFDDHQKGTQNVHKISFGWPSNVTSKLTSVCFKLLMSSTFL